MFCLLFAACSPKEDKQSIRIGASRSLTGSLKIYEDSSFGPIYKLWVKEVNAAGGIYVEEYGKKLPVEMIVYDDESNITKMTENLAKLILEDEVDLLFPPAGTDMLFVAATITSDLGYVLLGAEGGASKIEEIIGDMPYFFSVLGYSTHNQVPSFADLAAANNIKKVGIVSLADLHGVEYASATIPALQAKNIEVAVHRSIPVGVKDMSPIILEAKQKEVDAFMVFAYPDENILAVAQSMALGFNPNLFLVGPGGNFEFFAGIFGPGIEGLMSWGAWNAKVSESHADFAQKMIDEYGRGIIDWWGHNVYYASLQFLQAAIEDTGTLDQDKLRDAIATRKYQTVLGETWFDEGQLLALEAYSGQLGQWQNGIFEVVGPADKQTAQLVYPKPAWPAPPPAN